MNYKVTLWRNSDYCNLVTDPKECTFVVHVEADNEYQAREKALRPYILAKHEAHDIYPKIYEVVETSKTKKAQ